MSDRNWPPTVWHGVVDSVNGDDVPPVECHGTTRTIKTYRRLEELKQLREMQEKFFENAPEPRSDGAE